MGKNMEMNPDTVKKMSAAERIQLMEMLWDSMRYEEDGIETPEWHESILEERKAKIQSGQATFLSLAELKATRRK